MADDGPLGMVSTFKSQKLDVDTVKGAWRRKVNQYVLGLEEQTIFGRRSDSSAQRAIILATGGATDDGRRPLTLVPAPIIPSTLSNIVPKYINVGLERRVRKALWKGRVLPWMQIHEIVIISLAMES